MTTFAKLNLKDQTEIVIVNAPASFESEIASLKGVTVRRAMSEAQPGRFLPELRHQDEGGRGAGQDDWPQGLRRCDCVARLPEKSSKKYTCELNRDSGWPAMGEAGFEPVRMVAIDEDWSALRFRRAEFIKTMTRPKEHRMTKQAKARKE